MGSQRIRLILLILLFTCTFVVVHAATQHRLRQTQMPDWSVVPYEFEGWTGMDGSFDPVYGEDPAQTHLLRVYHRGPNSPVIAYVGFYRELPTILEVHSPDLCYPAQGWNILTLTRLSAESFRGKQIRASEIVVDKNGNRRLVMWWYNAGSQPFESRLRYVFALVAKSMLTGRSDGSIIRLETPLEKDGDATAQARIDQFRKSFLRELDKVLPQ